MLLRRAVQHIGRHAINAVGWRSNRKIVVIESDDWGSIRMPSRDTLDALAEERPGVRNNPYLRYDSLETGDDLNALFDVLCSVSDRSGVPAIVTANTVIANPDFQKIRHSDFRRYSFELSSQTYKRYPGRQDVTERWKYGINAGLIRPQYHGREHVNVARWMKALRRGDEDVHAAFAHGAICTTEESRFMPPLYLSGLDFCDEREKIATLGILQEGLDLFRAQFGFASRSMIANCYVWHRDQEAVAQSCGISILQGIPVQLEPRMRNGKRAYRRRYHFTGEHNQWGQRYLVRNVFFEPSITGSEGLLEECLHRIQVAFRWGKPAIIGSHRLNYIGSLDHRNRDRNLVMLQRLLHTITRAWPDVEFMSSDQLGAIMNP